MRCVVVVNVGGDCSDDVDDLEVFVVDVLSFMKGVYVCFINILSKCVDVLG